MVNVVDYPADMPTFYLLKFSILTLGSSIANHSMNTLQTLRVLSIVYLKLNPINKE